MSSPNSVDGTHRPRPADELSTSPAARRRWTLREVLIVSHVGLMAMIVAGFAISIFWMMWQATYRQAEGDLLGAAQVLLENLADGRDPNRLAITETYLHRFGPAPRDRAYFVLWNGAGERIVGSDLVPAEAVPATTPPDRSGPHPFQATRYGTHLDVVVATPDGGQLLIGRPLAKEFDELGRLARQLAFIGLLCLLPGAAAAVWLADRIAAPLVRVTETAERVSSRNLGERLEPGPATQEVARLTTVFNTMLAEIEAAFDRQTRFTADASHELRTPVTVVLAQAEHALSRERSSEDYRSALGTCRDAALRMKRLVDDLLLLSSADAGHLLTRQEAVDMADISRDAVRLLEPLARERDVRITTSLEPSPLVGDGGRLGQVVANLVTNAIRYNYVGGEVAISVMRRHLARQPVEIVLEVKDHGPGIPAEIQATLFNRFTRGDTARTTDGVSGTGLGLSIVREIISAHGGTVAVQSAPGLGTTMTVRLPVAGAREPAASASRR